MKAQPLNFLARAFAAFAMLGAMTGTTLAAPFDHAAATSKVNTPAARVDRDFGKVPLSFEANQGQTDAKVQFLSRGQGYALFLTPGEAVLELQKSVGKKADAAKTLSAPSVLRMTLVGGNAKAAVAGERPLPGTSNYFIGNDSSKWKTALPTYQRVAYSAVYPGVDLVYYGNQRQLEYDFVVAPGADAAKIALQFTGATPVIDKAGDLVLSVQGEEARFHKPVVYQLDGDRKVSVAGSYQIADGKVGFSLGTYDHSKRLVIDPILSYLTYIGGSGSDLINSIAVDSAGSVYIVGTTSSADFPVKNAYTATNPDTIAAATTPLTMFVSKFNPTGTALVYSTYLGGSEFTYGNGVAVDSSGNAYVVGNTTYGTYPVTAGAYQTLCGAEFDQTTGKRKNGCTGAGQGDVGGVLTKLNPTGTALVYSTYYSGDNYNVINAVAVDSSGQAYVTGSTNTYNYSGVPAGVLGDQCLPTTAGAVQTCEADSTGGGTRNFGFVAKFDEAGANLLYGSLLGPTTSAQSTTKGNAIAVDAASFAYIGGVTNNNLYTTTGAYQAAVSPNATGARAFAAKFDTVGKKIVYSTYVTGTDANSNVGEAVTGIAADAAGNAYLGGYTGDHSFPTTAGAYQTQTQSTNAPLGFVTKLNPSGSAPVWSTIFGNAVGTGVNSGGNAYIYGLTLGPDGSVYFAGQTSGGGLPTVNPLFSVSNGFGFVSRLSADGTNLLFSTPFGDSIGYSDILYGVAVDGSGNIYFAGQTNGNALPVTPGAFQTTNKGPIGSNYFYTGLVGKIAPFATTTTALTLPTGTITAGQSVTFSAKVTGQTGSTGTPTGTVTLLSGSTTLGTGTLDSTATATYTATSLNATTYNVTASYAGDTAFSASVSAAQSLVVTPVSATVTLTAPATATVGSSVTLSVAVTGPPGTPTGTVTFKDGTTTLGTATLASGAATYKTSALTVGTHALSVSYTGDSVFGAATSTTQNLVVSLATPTVTLTAPATALVGASVSLSVAVAGTPGTPTGTVTFKDGTTTLGTATLVSGAAKYTTSALAVGAHSITVSYSGDSVFGAATSAASTVTIGVPPAISFAAQPTSLTVVHGSSGTIVITGTPVGGYTGTVTFACGKLPASASCTFAPTSLTFTGNNVAASTTLTFSTTATTAFLEMLPGTGTLGAVFAAMLFLPIVARKKGMRNGVRLAAWLLLIGGSVSLLGLSGCGGGGSKSPTTITTAPGAYTVAVTITAGTATSTLNLSVTVQ
jgi:hypothetical protein